MNPNTSAWMGEEHILLQDVAKKFFAEELTPNVGRWRDAGIVDRDFWNKAGDAGLLGAAVPVEYVGSGGTNALDAVVIYEQARAGDSTWGSPLLDACRSPAFVIARLTR